MKRLNVLVSAYACNPISSLRLHPGEDLTGWRLTQQLSRFHNLWVIAHDYNKESILKTLEENNSVNIKFYFISLPRWFNWLYHISFGKRIYYYLWQISAWRLANKLNREFNFDVAHHITFGNYWIPSFIGAFLPVKFIWGPLGGGQRVPWVFFREYTLRGKISEISRDIAQWFGRNILFPHGKCLGKASAILVCNRETQNKIPRIFLKKLFLFPINGIAENELTKEPPQYRADKNDFLVLTAGRLDRVKGFSIAIRAFSLFADKFPKARLEIIGQGPEETRLKRLTQELKMGEKIYFISWLTREELLSKMRQCDAFLFPSLRDGGGAVVVEAMASAKPVICLDIGGPGFHIQKDWGIKIAPLSFDYAIRELAKALERIYLNEELRIQMCRAARRRAEEFYLWDRLGEQLQKIYDEIR